MTRIGSLCSGYRGLDLAVQAVIGGTVAWDVEYNPDAARILDFHWPDTPNHGDLTLTDWRKVEPVDVVTAGYPCQPFSHAGKRKGTGDERHLWPYVAGAIRVLRPRLVFLENVAGHVSLGLGTVVGELSSLGYDARWGCLPASAVGAPHTRQRLFIVAADSRDGAGHGEWARPEPGQGSVQPPADADADAEHAPQRERDGGGLDGASRQGEGDSAERERVRDAADESSATAADSDDLGHERSWGARGRRGGPANSGIAAAHTGREGLEGSRTSGPHTQRSVLERTPGAAAHTAGAERRATEPVRLGATPGSAAEPRERPCEDECAIGWNWGDYTAAIHRWHRTFRCVPAPVQPASRGGRPQLAPRFVEWMQALPAGHVTDPDIWDGMKPAAARNAQLTALGNGVVPPQAEAAYRLMLPDLLTLERAA